MGEADHRSKCEQSKRRMENERNELGGVEPKTAISSEILTAAQHDPQSRRGRCKQNQIICIAYRTSKERVPVAANTKLAQIL